MDGVEDDPIGVNPADDPGLPLLLFSWIDESVETRMPGVTTGQLIEMFQGSFADQLGFATDLDEAHRVIGVDDEQAQLRVPEQVSTLPPLRVVLIVAHSPS